MLNVAKRIYGRIYLRPCLIRLLPPEQKRTLFPSFFVGISSDFASSYHGEHAGRAGPPCTHDVDFSHPGPPFLPKLPFSPSFLNVPQEGFGDAVVLGCNSEGGVFWLKKNKTLEILGGFLKSLI